MGYKELCFYFISEPNAISRKWANSASDGLDDPSAIFEATDTTARCIWYAIFATFTTLKSYRGNFIISPR